MSDTFVSLILVTDVTICDFVDEFTYFYDKHILNQIYTIWFNSADVQVL